MYFRRYGGVCMQRERLCDRRETARSCGRAWRPTTQGSRSGWPGCRPQSWLRMEQANWIRFGEASDSAGIECIVAAPSKLQRPSGHRGKSDARDADPLAWLALLGQISPVVRVPARTDEAARVMVRYREDVLDLMRARDHVSKHLLRHGLIKPTEWAGRLPPTPTDGKVLCRTLKSQ